MEQGDGGGRLIPRWYAVTVLLFLALMAVTALVLLLVHDGPRRWPFGAVLAFACLMLVSAISSLARPRRRREPSIADDGTRTFLAPGATVYPLLAALGVVLLSAPVVVHVAVTDIDSVGSPRFALSVVLLAVVLLPDLLRLLTGRLHRWRLDLGPETVRYRGYRTDVTYPWSKVHGARMHARKPAGVRIDVKGAGKDPVVPITAFAVPAEQLVEEIERAKTAARR